MSIYRRMLGRELPCTLRQLLAIEPKKLPTKQKDILVRRVAVSGDVQSLYRLGFSHLAADQWGAAIGYLSTALELHPSHISSHLALAITYEGLGQHHKAAAQLDEILALNPVTSSIDTDTI